MTTIGTFPLTGIRAATTDPQNALIARAVAVLKTDPRMLAAWLVGSFAVGEADPFSDVDLHCLVEDDSFAAVRADWQDLVREVAPMVLVRPFRDGDIGGTCITRDWLHLDLVLHQRSALDPMPVEGMAPLFDKTNELLPTGPTPRRAVVSTPYFPAETVDWFFYMLGSLPVVVGRDEPAWAMNGVIVLCDDCLVPLMFAERGVRKVGGNKRLNPFLSVEQRQVLLDLPPLAPTVDSVIEAEIAIAREFIPRGRALALTTSSPWPQELEDATVGHFERSFGARIFQPRR